MLRKPADRSRHSVFSTSSALSPLAERMRPNSLDEVVGQPHLLGEGGALRSEIEAGALHSMILWGPPGCGKTSLALLLARATDAHFEAISAVLSGLPEVRVALAQAEERFAAGQRTVLFIDEVHRFNKAQQDAFLPHVERGVIVLVGATTENPSFELNSALLSRCQVYVLRPVDADSMVHALRTALADEERGLGRLQLQVSGEVLRSMAQAADGDVRRALGFLETAAEQAREGIIDEALWQRAYAGGVRRFDKRGDLFYEQISALHKSVRSSDPDAALYWLARMLDGGCDPHYLARRLLRMAIEDVGLADPRALAMAIDAWEAFDRLGSPEGELALAQVAVYLALAPRSNAVYKAFGAARQDVVAHGNLEVPMALRNAPTRLMKRLGYGRDYQYDHDRESGVAEEQVCLPEEIATHRYYEPVARGLETTLKEKWDAIRSARQQALSGRKGK